MNNNIYFTVIVSLICGIIFGISFELSHINEYYIVKSQFNFSHWIMLKMFLCASATSMIVLTLLQNITPVINKNTLLFTENYPRGISGLIIGSTLLGIGLNMTGSCPGTVMAQIGSGSIYSLYVLLGGLLGALLFGLMGHYTPTLLDYLQFGLFNNVGAFKYTVFQLFNVSRTSTCLIFASMLLLITYIIELYYPWRSDLSVLFKDVNDNNIYNNFKYIPPQLAGVMVGLLQFPLILLLGQHLGTSSSYVVVCSNLLSLPDNKLKLNKSAEFNKLKQYYWQVALVIGVAIGSFVASTLTQSRYVSDKFINGSGSSIMKLVLGGMIMIFGARLAAGCTSGSGVSGVGFQSLNSFIATAVMFGAAIISATCTNL